MMNDDIIYVIAEKMFIHQVFDKEYDVNKLMLVDRKCKRAFLSQFAKMRLVNLSYFNELEAHFYKSKKYEIMDDGPYDADEVMLQFLIMNRRFNPRYLSLTNIFSSPKWMNRMKKLYPTSTFQSIVSILNIEHLNLIEVPYLLDTVEINEYFNKHTADALTILALNAASYEINMLSQEYHCLEVPSGVSLLADRTTTLCLTFNSEWNLDTDNDESYQDFPDNEWITFMSFVLRSCPNLKRLNIRIHLNDYYDKYVYLLTLRLHKTIEAFVNRIFPKVLTDNNFALDGNIYLQVRATLCECELSEVPFSEFQLFSNFYKGSDSPNEIVRHAFFDRAATKLASKQRAREEINLLKSMDPVPALSLKSNYWTSDEAYLPGCWVGYALFKESPEVSDTDLLPDEFYSNDSDENDYDFDDDDLEYL